MDFLIVIFAAVMASMLTLYSGFGLGTLLLPVFVLFFPAPVAVAATAFVHLLNNVFKGGLLWRGADWSVLLRFGVPAIPAAIAGAWILGRLDAGSSMFEWQAAGRIFGPEPAGFTIGVMMILFALLEWQSWFQKLATPRRFMPLGGLITGFLGGLTGHQGALRSAFLLKSGLEARAFVATGVMIAILVDLARLPAYAASLWSEGVFTFRELALVGTASLAAFAGAYIGTRTLEKVTLDMVRHVVAVLMIGIGSAMVTGLVG
ncbi:MAG: TSUP family transporter [Alphaproteobacteria bacterium]|nr:TSUP family transporter [Alphaproteobacteria bacterium]